MMRLSKLCAVAACSAAIAAPAHALVVGQTDTFAAGVEGWFAGGGPMGATPPNPPAIEPGGGPGGAGDSYLTITSTGSGGPGGRLVAMNAARWAGNYLAAGVTGITMDVRNFGASDLTVQLLFEDPGPGAPLNIAATEGRVLPAGSGWTRVNFGLAAADFTALQGDVATLLGATTLIRLYHGPAAAFPADPIAASLGVDNITAVPEPETYASMLAGLALVGGWAWRGRRRRG